MTILSSILLSLIYIEINNIIEWDVFWFSKYNGVFQIISGGKFDVIVS